MCNPEECDCKKTPVKVPYTKTNEALSRDIELLEERINMLSKQINTVGEMCSKLFELIQNKQDKVIII